MRVFGELRTPRTQRVVELSREFGRTYAFVEEGVGEDLEETRRRLGEGGRFTNEVDLEGLNAEAVRRFLEM